MRLKSMCAPACLALAGLCLLAASGCGSDRPTASQVSSGVVVIGGKEYQVGYGYDITTDSPKLADAISGVVIQDTQGAVSGLSIEYIENNSELQSLTSRQINVQVNAESGGDVEKKVLPAFSAEGGYSSSTSDSIKLTSKSIALYARQRVPFGDYIFEAEALTTTGAQALGDLPTFVSRYGNTYLKKATFAADLVYVYCYEYEETDETKRSEMKAKLKAGLKNTFGMSADVTLTQEDKAKISSISKTIKSYTNVASFVIPAVETIEQWRLAQSAFQTFLSDPKNARNLQYVEATFRPYSDIPSPIWTEHPEYKAAFDRYVQLRTWQEQWNRHKTRIADVMSFTLSPGLQQQCAAALSLIEVETSKIRSDAVGARPPLVDEFSAIYGQYFAFTGFNRFGYGVGVVTPGFGLGASEGVVTGDFNGDGSSDLLVRTVGTGPWSPGPFYSAIYLSRTDGTFTRVGYGTAVVTPGFSLDWYHNVFTGDFNGDGRTDLFVRNWGVARVSAIFLSLGDGTFTRVGYGTAVVTPGFGLDLYDDVSTGDFNGDGRTDLLVRNRGAAHVSAIFLSLGDGTFTRVGYGTAVVTPGFWLDWNEDIFTGDFNGDGRIDLLVRNRVARVSAIYLSLGDGTFTRVGYGTAFVTPGFGLDGNEDVFTGDFNGDGSTDLLVRNRVSHTSALYLSRGNGEFDVVGYGNQGSVTPGFWLDANEDVFTGDFNGDGSTDLLVRNRASHTSAIYLSKWDGSFQPYGYSSTDLLTPGFWLDGNERISVGDFNGDGWTDLLVGNTVSRYSAVYLVKR